MKPTLSRAVLAAVISVVLAGSISLLGQRPAGKRPTLRVGDPAPDFTLETYDKKARVQLSSFRGQRPVVLAFGSYTCPTFRREVPALNKFYQEYKDRAAFFVVYIQEAHPSDLSPVDSNVKEGILFPNPKSYPERVSLAGTSAVKLGIQLPALVDDIANSTEIAYSGWPNRLYVINRDGRIGYKGDAGPYGFQPDKARLALQRILQPAPASETTRRESKLARALPSVGAPALSDAGPRLGAINNLIDAGDLAAAREKLLDDATGPGSQDPKVLYLQAKILFKEKRFPESLKLLEQCLRSEQRRAAIYKLIALNAIGMDRIDIAEAALTSAAQVAPNDYTIHLHLGLLYYTSARMAEAIAELQQVTKLQPNFMKGYDILGMIHEDNLEDEAAIRSFRQAIDLTDRQNLKDESAYLHLGNFLVRSDSVDEGLPLLQRAVGLNPQSAEAFYGLGKAYDRLGDGPKAIESLKRAIQIDPNYPDPHYLLGRVYLRQGQKEIGSKELETYRELMKLEAKK